MDSLTSSNDADSLLKCPADIFSPNNLDRMKSATANQDACLTNGNAFESHAVTDNDLHLKTRDSKHNEQNHDNFHENSLLKKLYDSKETIINSGMESSNPDTGDKGVKHIVTEVLTNLISNIEHKEDKTQKPLKLPTVTPSKTSVAVSPTKVLPQEAVVSPRVSKRKRVPKRSMDYDEEKKEEKKPPPTPVKEKVPLVETEVNWKIADLVWAYVPGHPLWPCMVTLHPEEDLFTKMSGRGPKGCRVYHVQFLGDRPERGWITESRIFLYQDPEDYAKIIKELMTKTRKNPSASKIPKIEIPTRLKADWDSALSEIIEAVPHSADERIELFAYDFKPIIKKLKEPNTNTSSAVPSSTNIKLGQKLKQLKQKHAVKRLNNAQSKKEHLRAIQKQKHRIQQSDKLKQKLLNGSTGAGLNMTDAKMFELYCQKHKPSIAVQNPEMTPEQIESMIWMEWEALSLEERKRSVKSELEEEFEDYLARKRKQRNRVMDQQQDEESSSDSDKNNDLAPLDGSAESFSCPYCYISYPTKVSLGQHKRWCIPPPPSDDEEKKDGRKSSADGSTSAGFAFTCKKCSEKFFSAKALQIHKKFCSTSENCKVSASSNDRSLKNNPPDDGSSNGDASEQSVIWKRWKGPQLGSTTKRENICAVCEKIEEGLLPCTGGCCQSYHPQCINLHPPASDSETPSEFICINCKENTHPCFICNKTATESSDDLGEMKRCSVQNCGRIYHATCLHLRKLAILKDKQEKEKQSFMSNAKCTLHHCATCAAKANGDDSCLTNLARQRMFKCVRCPTAYHAGDDCIAAGSVILPGLNIICPEHFEPHKQTPHHQPVHVSWCFVCSKGGQLVCCEGCPAAFHPSCVNMEKPPEEEWFCEDCRSRRRPLYGEIVWVKLGSYRWWPGEITHPNEIPDNIERLQHGIGEFVVKFFGSNDYFWLNKRRVFLYQEGDTGASGASCSRGISSVFNKALQTARERFENIVMQKQKIQDRKSMNKRPSYKHIKVNKPYGNVQVYTADPSEISRCICKRTDPHPCGPESECLNRMLMYECNPSLCPSGEKCENQRFQKREYPESEVFRTNWGGWGLRTKVKIKKGEFVNEYVGELVDNEECLKRIEQAHKNNVTNFYMLTIDKDRIIDAGPKGNYSRFMNHCCDPSCETQKWAVNGDTRVGLFARREIEPGEELCFNYNLDCLGNDKTVCMCGSKNCSGFIGVRPKPHMESGSHMSSHRSKKKKRKTETRIVPKHDDFCFRCRLTGTLVCCDVRGCQRAFCLSCLRLSKPPFGKWECPWHHCDFCGRRAQSFCHFCPNSFCTSHVNNQLVKSVPNKYDCCTDHDPNVAEYEMEEAIITVAESMIPPPGGQWEEEVLPQGSKSDKTSPKVKEVKLRHSRSGRQIYSKIPAGDSPVSTPTARSPASKKRRGRPKKLDPDEASLLAEVDAVKRDPLIKEEQEETSNQSDSEGDLEQVTSSSPVKRKRVRNKHYVGHRKKRKRTNTKNDVIKTIDDVTNEISHDVEDDVESLNTQNNIEDT